MLYIALKIFLAFFGQTGQKVKIKNTLNSFKLKIF